MKDIVQLSFPRRDCPELAEGRESTHSRIFVDSCLRRSDKRKALSFILLGSLRNNGSVLIMVVFVVALLSALVMGMLQMNTEEIQLMQNHIYTAEALAIAEAGLNDALAQIREDSSWADGFDDKPFNDGFYDVTVDGSTITATGTTSQGFVAEVEAEITVAASGPPYVIRIDSLKINE
jgi:Tfp pilus assembly protein PilX